MHGDYAEGRGTHVPPAEPVVVREVLAVPYGRESQLLVVDEPRGHILDGLLVHSIDAGKQLCLWDAASVHKQLPANVLCHTCKPCQA